MIFRMMKVAGLTLAVGAGFAAVAAAEPTETPEINKDMRDAMKRVELRHAESEAQGEQYVREANRLLVDNRYMDARDKYIAAIRVFEQFPSDTFRKRTEWCREQISKCYIYRADEAILLAEERAQVRDFEEAIALCKEALVYAPECKPRLTAKITEYESRQGKALLIADTSAEKLLPNQKNQQYQVQVLLEQGRQLIKAGDYMNALKKFNEVLLLDPYNADALQNVRATYRKIDDVGHTRFANQFRQVIAEVEWKYANSKTNVDPRAASMIAADKIKVETKLTPLQEKLNNIIIPRIDFEDISISTAVKNLRDQSRQQDPEQLGINIFLMRGDTGVPAAGAPAAGGEGAAPPAAPAAGGEGAAAPDEKRITLMIQEKSLMDAIVDLCNAGQLRYKIEKHAVVLAPAGVALENLETRLYPMDQPPVDNPDNVDELRNYFVSNGVDFPQGSKVLYDRRINRLIVSNTLTSHQRIEVLVNEVISQQEPLIQVMMKFMEIAQNDLQELAFNYQLAVNANKAAVTGNTATRTARFDSGSNSLTRYYRPDTANTVADPMQDGHFTYNWSNSDGTSLNIAMFALNQADSVDVLSAPRVTTLPDKPAMVEMVVRQYFPNSYNTVDLPRSSGTSSSSSSTSSRPWIGIRADPQPELGTDNEEKLGITFTVTPTILDKDRRLIGAQVYLPIMTFSGWMNYDARTYDSEGSVDGEYYKMPIFDLRQIETKVSIYDGETIILGGVTQDKSETIFDKIPILGDIPVIGRLFQSRVSASEKRTLLIFMSCRLVKPDGTAFYPDEVVSRGLPDFGSRL